MHTTNEALVVSTTVVVLVLLLSLFLVPALAQTQSTSPLTCGNLVPVAAPPPPPPPRRLHALRLTEPGQPTVPRRARASASASASAAGRAHRLVASASAAAATDTDTTSTIFVSVPAYRDSETPHTLLSILTRAAAPERVVVGVNEQWAPPDTPVLVAAEALAAKLPDSARVRRLLRSNVRMLRMPAQHAKGPVFARSLIQERLYRGEDFLLMVDSHMQFAPAWDTGLLAEYAATPTKPSVLTCYSHAYSRSDRDGADFSATPNRLQFGQWEEGSDMPMWGSIPQTYLDAAVDPPQPSIAWAAGFSFAPREAATKVPFHHGDMYPHLFFGEEVGMAARFFTHGVDLYTPRHSFALTTYERGYRPLYWDETPNSDEYERLSQTRIRALLGMRASPDTSGLKGRYALGTARSLAAYFVYSGINMHSLEVSDAALIGITA